MQKVKIRDKSDNHSESYSSRTSRASANYQAIYIPIFSDKDRHFLMTGYFGVFIIIDRVSYTKLTFTCSGNHKYYRTVHEHEPQTVFIRTLICGHYGN